jgi:hypothetical protein
MSIAGLSPNRPNGCRPTPMIATSFISMILRFRPARKRTP